MIVNQRAFEFELDKFSDLIGKTVADATRLIALHLLRKLVLKTPVDTGNARVNWNISTGSPDDSVLDVSGERTLSPEEATRIALQKGNSLSFIPPFGSVWIANNVPYILVLENGSSQQAPQGFVAISVAEIENQINSILADV